jgi:hypothetical protein
MEIKPLELTVMGKSYTVAFQAVTVDGKVLITPVVTELPVASAKRTPPTNTTESLDEQIDWLDPILEHYWKQRHGMYNANQDDVEMANQEAKEAIANKIVELVLKDRRNREQEVLRGRVSDMKSLLQKSERHEADGICNSEFYVSTDHIHANLAELNTLLGGESNE